jgi:hypothetical protein
MRSHQPRLASRSIAATSFLCLLLIASPAFASCGDRPGTPVDMTATQTDNQILLDFTNTATEAPIFWDVEVTDGAGHYLGGGAAGVVGTVTEATGGQYSVLGRYQLAPIQGGNFHANTYYCFRVRARTASGTEGCVSKLWNNPVCVTTPDTSVNQFCSTYARDAINQFNYLRNVKYQGNCGDNGPRWTSTWLQHYNWCIDVRAHPETAGQPDFERNERNKRLQVCSNYTCLNNVCKQIKPIKKTGKTKTPEPSPSPTPSAPENQCKVTVWVTNDECINGDRTPMTSNPAGALQTFGCGATEDAALANAKLQFYQAQGPYLSDGDSPCPGCCTYKKKVEKGCACSVRTYGKKVKMKPCLRGMVRNSVGACICPAGTRWTGHLCRRRATATPVAPPATSPARSTPASPPAPCPASRPVGSQPNCCPTGTVFSGGVCRQLAKPTTSASGGGTASGGGASSSGGGSTAGTCPRSRPVGSYPHCCPRGMIYRGHMCRHDFARKTAPAGNDAGTGGASGINPGNTGGRCPASRPVGTPPHCCPAGTTYRGHMCRHLPKPGTGPSTTSPGTGTKPATGGGCPRSRPVGTPPHCCPRGTSYQNGKCVHRGSTTTTPTTPGKTTPGKTTTPSSRKCSGGRRGVPPHCYCAGGRRFIGGRCRSIPKPKPPTPSKDSGGVIVK